MKLSEIKVAARGSPLSLAQVKEVFKEIDIPYTTRLVKTAGDKDQKTSLKYLGQTDFFTKEVDQLVLSGECRIAIHSAKDLPEPIPEGLEVIALTKGEDPSDSLVLKNGIKTLEDLPKGAVIATSSLRREENLRKMRPDLVFVDIRGTINERLEKLGNEKLEDNLDGVVIAEAALRRLNLNPNRIKIEGPTAELQGKLAILARQGDEEAKTLFSPLDTREKHTLYLGLRCPSPAYFHDPAIQIQTYPFNPPNLEGIQYILITSPTAAHLFHAYISNKFVICTGEGTKKALATYGISSICPENESSEGIIDLIKAKNLQNETFFWPHSALSKPLIKNFLGDNVKELILYTTVSRTLTTNCRQFKELIVTSPSCAASLQKQLAIPLNIKAYPARIQI